MFTERLAQYASLVLDHPDLGGKIISHRLYVGTPARRWRPGKFVMDPSVMGRGLDRVVSLDDNPSAYLFQPEDAVPVAPVIGSSRIKVTTFLI